MLRLLLGSNPTRAEPNGRLRPVTERTSTVARVGMAIGRASLPRLADGPEAKRANKRAPHTQDLDPLCPRSCQAKRGQSRVRVDDEGIEVATRLSTTISDLSRMESRRSESRQSSRTSRPSSSLGANRPSSTLSFSTSAYAPQPNLKTPKPSAARFGGLAEKDLQKVRVETVPDLTCAQGY